MDFKQLEYFLETANSKCISKAAKKLFVTQPAISQSIKSLERELDTKLFNREGTNIVLTSSGEIFYKYACDCILCIDTAVSKIKDLQAGKAGIISIGSWNSIGLEYLPKLMKGFHKDYPNIRLDIIQDEKQALFSRLNLGTIDLCFARKLPENSKFTKLSLPNDYLVIIGKKDFFTDSNDCINIASLKNTPFIIKKNLINSLTALCEKNSFQPFIYCFCDDLNTSVMLAKAGLGITIIPKSYLSEYSTDCLTVKRIAEHNKIKECSILYNKSNISSSAKLFINYLRHIQQNHSL